MSKIIIIFAAVLKIVMVPSLFSMPVGMIEKVYSSFLIVFIMETMEN